MENIMIGFEIMGKGMLGIFAVIIVVMAFVMVMSKLGKKKEKDSK